MDNQPQFINWSISQNFTAGTTNYIIPYDGWLYVYAFEGYNTIKMILDGVELPYVAHSGSGYSSACFFVKLKKGTTMVIYGASNGTTIKLFTMI